MVLLAPHGRRYSIGGACDFKGVLHTSCSPILLSTWVLRIAHPPTTYRLHASVVAVLEAEGDVGSRGVVNRSKHCDPADCVVGGGSVR
jgi:hypothetical protein